MDIRALLRRLCAIAVKENLECPTVTKVYIYKSSTRIRGGWVKILEGVYIEPVTESLAVKDATPDMLIFRLTAGYMALAYYKTYGRLDAKRAESLARRYYFKLLVGG